MDICVINNFYQVNSVYLQSKNKSYYLHSLNAPNYEINIIIANPFIKPIIAV